MDVLETFRWNVSVGAERLYRILIVRALRVHCYTIGFIKFEWDENKAARNLSKHGVSFEEAKTVFDDPLYIDFYDPDHSEDEARYLIVGSNRKRSLILSYTQRGNSIRLSSAREVTRSEREAYEEG